MADDFLNENNVFLEETPVQEPSPTEDSVPEESVSEAPTESAPTTEEAKGIIDNRRYKKEIWLTMMNLGFSDKLYLSTVLEEGEGYLYSQKDIDSILSNKAQTRNTEKKIWGGF